MYKLSIAILLLYPFGINAQLVKYGAKINGTIQIIKNLKKDFNAKGDGITNDHNAFRLASLFINKNGGNVQLIIPKGTYVVGKQINNIGKADYHHPVFKGESILDLINVKNVFIIGEAGSIIVYKDSLKFGTFEKTTGKKPGYLDEYNPSATIGKNAGYDYTYNALIGNCIQIDSSANILIKNLVLNGNSSKYILGGNWGLGDRPIELNNCHGIVITNTNSCTFENINVHHFGVDNICIKTAFLNGDTSKPLLYNIYFNNLISDYAGRNGISWLGGKNLYVYNSVFKNSGRGVIKTKPSYGMDIEPEGNTGQVLCSNGYFFNVLFEDNASQGFTTGTSLDNPVAPSGYGFSYNHYFKKCTVVGRYASAIHNFINRVVFDSCNFYGNVLNYGSSVNNLTPTTFKNCYFSDCYKGIIFPNVVLLNLVYSHKTIVKNCIFEKYHISYTCAQIFQKDSDTIICENDAIKPIFENSIFKLCASPLPEVIYASHGKKISFKNNKFYNLKSDKIRWYNTVGCNKKAEQNGCIDLGNGLQYLFFDQKIKYPTCASGKKN